MPSSKLLCGSCLYSLHSMFHASDAFTLHLEVCTSWSHAPVSFSPTPLPSGSRLFVLCIYNFFLFCLFCFLDSTYKWNHTVFVFLCMTYFTKHKLLQMAKFHFFYSWVIFHCVCMCNIPLCMHAFIHTHSGILLNCKQEWNSGIYVCLYIGTNKYYIFFIHSSVDRHLDCPSLCWQL